jgi:hypothetical protein
MLLLLLMGFATVKVEAADDDKVVNVAALHVNKILPLPTVLLLVHCLSDRDDARQKIDRVAMMSLFDFF